MLARRFRTEPDYLCTLGDSDPLLHDLVEILVEHEVRAPFAELGEGRIAHAFSETRRDEDVAALASAQHRRTHVGGERHGDVTVVDPGELHVRGSTAGELTAENRHRPQGPLGFGDSVDLPAELGRPGACELLSHLEYQRAIELDGAVDGYLHGIVEA